MKKLQKPKRLSKVPRQSLSAHFQELRLRIILWLACVVAGSVAGYALRDELVELLIRPLNQPLFYLSPAGGLNFVLTLSLSFGLLASLPVLAYHVFRFVSPAFPKTPKHLVLLVVTFSAILLIIGVAFAYFAVLPSTLLFLNEFGDSRIQSLISTDQYLSFITRYLLGFGLFFQLPLVVLTVNSFRKLTLKEMLKFERWVILISFVASAVITPTTDLFNLTIMALPIIALYQFSILVVFLNNRLKKRYN